MQDINKIYLNLAKLPFIINYILLCHFISFSNHIYKYITK